MLTILNNMPLGTGILKLRAYQIWKDLPVRISSIQQLENELFKIYPYSFTLKHVKIFSENS